MRAKITWLPNVAGGRRALPSRHRYVTVARFPEEGEHWHDDARSVVVTFPIPPSEQGSPALAEVEFLSAEAPRARLAPGRQFELCEGARTVARVEVVK
jgi:hypothetical protein